jgi:glucose uptake protein GlcU
MKRFSLLAFTLLTLIASAYAQFTLTSIDFPAMDTVTVTTAMPTMTEISATGTAVTTIICLRVWPNAIIFLPD